MKKIFLSITVAMLFGTVLPVMAQQKKGNVRSTTRPTKVVAKPTIKNPIVGSWYFDDQYGLELKLKETAKKGNFIHNDKVVCYGGLAVSEYYEYFLMLSMQVKKVISNTEVEYTVSGSDERKPSKTVKGTIRLKKVGNRLLITGTETNGKKWPFDGFYLTSN